MPTLKQNRKASCSRSHTTHSETHNFLTQVQQPPQQQQPMHQHNLKRKVAEPEDVAEEEDSENDVMESPEIKRAKTEYLKSLYAGKKQQSEVVLVVVETEEKKKEEESHSNEDDAEIQKKKYEDIWRQAKILRYVAPIPAIAEAITDTPDALLHMIKTMDPETFCQPPLNSVARKWLGSSTSSSAVISFESKKKDDADDDDDLEDATSHKTNGKKSKRAASAKKKSNDEDDSSSNADDADDDGGAASKKRRRTKKKTHNVTMVYLEKHGMELSESTKKLIEKCPEKHICCADGHRLRAGPFVDTNNNNNKRSKKMKLNLNSKTKPAAAAADHDHDHDHGSKNNDSDDEETAAAAAAAALAVADSDDNNDDFDEEKEDVDEFGLLIPPPKIQQLQKAMIEQKPSKVNIVCICCAEVVPANFIACHCPSDECVLKNENPKKKGFRTQVCKKCFLNLGLLPGAIGTVLQLRKSVKDPKHDEKYNEVTNAIQVHLEKVSEMKTRPKAFHPDHMDQTYFLNEDGNEEYTFVSTELKLKIKDAYHKAVNSEKYIQELKLEVAQLIHVQEEMKKIIREKKEALVLAKTCYLHRLKKKQEAAAAEEETDDEADEADEADGGCGGGKKEDKHKSSTGTSSSEEEEDSSSSSSSSDDSDDDSDNDDFNIV